MTTNEKYIEIEKKVPKNWYIDKIFGPNHYYFGDLEEAAMHPLVLAIITDNGYWITAQVIEADKEFILEGTVFYHHFYDDYTGKNYLEVIDKEFGGSAEFKGRKLKRAPTALIHHPDFHLEIEYMDLTRFAIWDDLHEYILHAIKELKKIKNK